MSRQRPRRPCAHHRCPEYATDDSAYCVQHAPAPSPSARAINTNGPEWHRYRGRIVQAINRGHTILCGICHQRIIETDGKTNPEGLVIDHVTPVANGGAHDPSNWAPAHRRCNATKSGGVRAYTPRITHPAMRRRKR